MRVRHGSRGQPLAALVLVLGAWVAVRMLFWDVGLLSPAASAEGLASAIAPIAPLTVPIVDQHERVELAPGAEAAWPIAYPASEPGRRPYFARVYRPSYGARSPGLRSHAPERHGYSFASVAHVPPNWLPLPSRPDFPELSAAPRGLSRIGAAPGSGDRPGQGSREGAGTGEKRWSGDGWLLFRGGGGGPAASGALPSVYGASQAGAVLRYRVMPGSRHRPSAYLRATAAMNGLERDIAAGMSARPLAGLPIVAQAELRATQMAGRTRLRPAVLAVTELPPFRLPRDFAGEAYAQAGYVAGSNATPFADAQLRIERPVTALGRAQLRAGAGAWGGAQKGAARLDVGPAASMGLGLGQSASARVAVDWRFRVAGRASPASGPALTLSAGF